MTAFNPVISVKTSMQIKSTEQIIFFRKKKNNNNRSHYIYIYIYIYIYMYIYIYNHIHMLINFLQVICASVSNVFSLKCE